ncbi:hypothetical protein ACB094_04G032400 [Castanea mollissima]
MEDDGFLRLYSYNLQKPNGFVFIDESKRTLGCERNSTTENCNEKGMNITMEEVPGIIWENVTYSQSLLSTKQDCNDACLQDCSCEAALFNDRVCRKQKLPLRFVNIKIPNDPKAALAFIKIRTS